MCTRLSSRNTKNLPIFSSCTICFGRSVDFSVKSKLRKQVVTCGGSVASFLTPQVTHLVTDKWDETQAKKCHGCIVTTSWISDSIKAEVLKGEAQYLLLPTVKKVAFGFKTVAEEDVNKKIGNMFQSAILNINALQTGSTLVKKTEKLKISSGFKPSEPTANRALEYIKIKKEERERQREETLRKAQERLEKAKLDFAQKQEAIKREREAQRQQKIREKEAEAKERANRIATLTASTVPSKIIKKPLSTLSTSSTTTNNTTITPLYNPSSTLSLTSTEKQDILEISSIKKYLDEYTKQEERQKRILAAEKRKQEFELKQLKKKLKKEQVAAAREANAKIGKEIAEEKRRKKDEEKQQKRLAYEQKQLEWQLTQKEREIAWKAKLQAEKLEKKAKKREFVAKKQEFLKKEASERGRKLFIGKITFDDLVKSADSEQYVKDRKEQLLTILRSFGHLEEVIEHWEKGFIFIIYVNRYDAEKAYSTLSKFEERKALCKNAKATLKLSGAPALVVPKPNFYVRWPKGHNIS